MIDPPLTPIHCPWCGESLLYQSPATGDAIFGEEGEVVIYLPGPWEVEVKCGDCDNGSRHQRVGRLDHCSERLGLPEDTSD